MLGRIQFGNPCGSGKNILIFLFIYFIKTKSLVLIIMKITRSHLCVFTDYFCSCWWNERNWPPPPNTPNLLLFALHLQFGRMYLLYCPTFIVLVPLRNGGWSAYQYDFTNCVGARVPGLHVFYDSNRLAWSDAASDAGSHYAAWGCSSIRHRVRNDKQHDVKNFDIRCCFYPLYFNG